MLQPRGQWNLAATRLAQGWDSTTNWIGTSSSVSERLRQARAAVLARGIAVVRTSSFDYIDDPDLCGGANEAPCCAQITVRASGSLSAESQVTLAHHEVATPTASGEECGSARVFFEAWVDGTGEHGGEFVPDRGRFVPGEDPPVESYAACTDPGECSTGFACVEGFCEPMDLLYDRYRAPSLWESENFFELMTSGERLEENPLLANRLFGIGLKSWAEDGTGAGVTQRGPLRRNLLRSWPARLDAWDAQRVALESTDATTGVITRPDIAFVSVCEIDAAEADPDPSNGVSAFDTSDSGSLEYTPSGTFIVSVPAMFFDIVPAKEAGEGELDAELPAWALMANVWPAYEAGGILTPLVASPGYFFAKTSAISYEDNIECTTPRQCATSSDCETGQICSALRDRCLAPYGECSAAADCAPSHICHNHRCYGPPTENYTYEDYIISTNDTLKGSSGGAVVVPQFVTDESQSVVETSILRSIGVVAGGAGTTWSDVRCGTHGDVACNDDSDCAATEACVSSVCITALRCSTDANCPNGQVCVDGVCFNETSPSWSGTGQCVGWSGEQPPGTDVALHTPATVEWSTRAPNEPGDPDGPRDFEASLAPLEITSSVPVCLTDDAPASCGLFIEEGQPLVPDGNGPYVEIDEPQNLDVPQDTDQGSYRALTRCRNTQVPDGSGGFEKVGLGVGLIGGAVLNEAGNPVGIGSLMLVCAPYHTISWHLNWRHLIAQGRVVEQGEDSLLFDYRWGYAHLWRLLTYFVERRRGSGFQRVCEGTACENIAIGDEYLRPVSMQLCPPNYYLKGIGMGRSDDNERFLGVSYLRCVRTFGGGERELIVRTFTGETEQIQRENGELVGGYLSELPYDNFTMGLPYATNDHERWLKFSLEQHIGDPHAFRNQGSAATLEEFFCPERAEPTAGDPDRTVPQIISGFGWKSAPGTLQQFVIECIDLP